MLAIQASVYVIREERWFWSSTPSLWLSVATLAMVGFSLLVAGMGILMAPLGSKILGTIMISAAVFTLLLDLLKHLAVRVERRGFSYAG